MSQGKRPIVIGYIRVSVGREGDVSPDRQRDNIQRYMDEFGFEVEFYEDTIGHNSGMKRGKRKVDEVEKRLLEPDVIGIALNEQSRYSRDVRDWTDLLHLLQDNAKRLFIGSERREIDVAKDLETWIIQLRALIDSQYVFSVRQRAKDSVRYRKLNGQTIGIPPFGTVRHPRTRHLMLTKEGCWLLPDGRYEYAESSSDKPSDRAVWFGFAECAQEMLKLYVKNQHGYPVIAAMLNEQGWRKRTRQYAIRLIDGDDVRRVVANVHTYAGLLIDGKAISRPAYALGAALLTDAEYPKAVFDIDLLRQVEQVWLSRSRQIRPKGQKRNAYPLALTQILYCAQCDAAAEAAQDLSRRSFLIGHKKPHELRYRHGEKHVKVCTCKAKSVKAEKVEDELFKVVKMLQVAEAYRDSFTATAIQMQAVLAGDTDDEIRRKMEAEAARLRQAISNLKQMAKAGYMAFEEAVSEIERKERELQRVQMMETRKTQVMVELAECIRMIDDLQRMWEVLSPLDRREMVQSLFTEISYDLDTGRITRFALDPIADMFLVVKGTDYAVQDKGTYHDPNGTRTRVLTLKG